MFTQVTITGFTAVYPCLSIKSFVTYVRVDIYLGLLKTTAFDSLIKKRPQKNTVNRNSYQSLMLDDPYNLSDQSVPSWNGSSASECTSRVALVWWVRMSLLRWHKTKECGEMSVSVTSTRIGFSWILHAPEAHASEVLSTMPFWKWTYSLWLIQIDGAASLHAGDALGNARISRSHPTGDSVNCGLNVRTHAVGEFIKSRRKHSKCF